MTVTTVRSAFPAEVADLLPRARELAAELGGIPSRNRLKAELRVGAPKASAVREALLATDTEPAESSRPWPSWHRLRPWRRPWWTRCPRLRSLAPVAEPAAVVVDVPSVAAQATPAVAVRKPVRSWPVLLLALPAFVAIWSGLGRAGGADRLRRRAPAARDLRWAVAEHGDHAADRGGDLRRVRPAGVAVRLGYAVRPAGSRCGQRSARCCSARSARSPTT